jgi:hypothetical protein
MRNIGDAFLSEQGIHSDGQFFIDNLFKIFATSVLQDFKEKALVEKKKELILDVQDFKNEVTLLREDVQAGDRDHTTLIQLRESNSALFKAKKKLKEIEREEGQECRNDVEGYAYFLRKKLFNLGEPFKKALRIFKNA